MADPSDIPSGFYISTPTNNAIANAPAIGIGPTGFGTVTQGTSKSTTVVVNAKAGVVTMHNAALAASTLVQFTMTNSAISATDVVVVNQGVRWHRWGVRLLLPVRWCWHCRFQND